MDSGVGFAGDLLRPIDYPPPALLLHGNPDAADLWAGVVARLGPHSAALPCVCCFDSA